MSPAPLLDVTVFQVTVETGARRSATVRPARERSSVHDGRQILRLPGSRQLGLELGHLRMERGHLILQLDHPLDALQPQTLGAQPRDLAQLLDIAQRVAPPSAAGATRRDDAEPVV